jgi:hypothetical protein
MYDPSEALLQLGLYDYVWGNPSLLQTYNANVQAQKAREEQAQYNKLWKAIEDKKAEERAASERKQELKEASVEMAKLNRELVNARPQDAIIIQRQQEALVNKFPELQGSTADAIAARNAENKYQADKVNILGKIPHTFASDAAIDKEIQTILNDPILRPEDKEAAIKDLQTKKSTAQMVSEAKQSAIASHGGKKTTEALEEKDLADKYQKMYLEKKILTPKQEQIRSKYYGVQ